jgi:hypothetical protein
MSELICGIYFHDAARRSLTHAVTGQSIRLTHSSAEGGWWFEYVDDETTTNFIVERHVVRVREDHVLYRALLDFNRPESQPVTARYGLWRRVVYFLLDSLMVWLFLTRRECDEQFDLLEVHGAWTNGSWQHDAIMRSWVRNATSANLDIPAYRTNYVPFPLHFNAVPWQYHANQNPALEFNLTETDSASNEVPILASTPSILDQLQSVPFFARADGKAFFHHRYVEVYFHRGEDYLPEPYYG